MKKLVEKNKNVNRKISTPAGELIITANSNYLVGVGWHSSNNPSSEKWPKSKGHKILDWAEKELREYFSKQRREFTVPLQPDGTEFQSRVWRELSKIPFGKTMTYSDVAEKIKKRAAVRAVGGAIGKNPISIIVPCHRVIGKSGKLTGFSGGLENKAALLEIEKGL